MSESLFVCLKVLYMQYLRHAESSQCDMLLHKHGTVISITNLHASLSVCRSLVLCEKLNTLLKFFTSW